MTLHQYLQVLFDSEDTICTGNMYSTTVHPQAEASGNFISINPLKESRRDANVTKFRNFLIEMDEGPLDEQMQKVREAGLPFSAATWSGSKSIHFIVSLEEPVDEKTWRTWAEALIRSVGADPATKNPSRFSRLPGSHRADKGTTQSLLVLNGRVPNKVVEEFVGPHIRTRGPNFRLLYNSLRGVTGVDAAHPMTKAFIAGTHPCEHGRNNALFKSAADLRDVGMSMEEAGSLLHGPAEMTGLSEREIVQTIRSAFQRERRA